MSLIIRHRCQNCGAPREGSDGQPWVHCGFCDNFIAFDWQLYFASPAHAAFLRSAAANAPRFAANAGRLTEAGELAQKGRLDRAEALLRAATEETFELLPYTAPPRVRTDPAYRAQYVAFNAAFLLLQRTDPELIGLDAELQAESRRIDFRNPLPGIEKIAALLDRQHRRLRALELPPDPDGMSPEQRGRLWRGLYLSAWLPMLDREKRLELLRKIYGAASVVERASADADAGADLGGMFHEWTCPGCGLCSLQSSAATERTCYGCMLRAPVASAPLPAVDVQCPNCGLRATLAAGMTERTCEICGAAVVRAGRGWQAEQQLARDVRQQIADRHGLTLPELPPEGTPGLPITADNRNELVADGLLRMASGFAALVDARRFAALVRNTFPADDAATGAERLTRLLAAARLQNAPANAVQLLEETRALLAAPGA